MKRLHNAAHNRNRRQLGLQLLERREMMTYGIAFNNLTGVVRIDGNGYHDRAIVDTVSVNGQATIKVTIGHLTSSGYVQDYEFSRPASQITAIDYQGQVGDDSFENNSSLPSTARGGMGHDTLIGGSGKDTLEGGLGVDSLTGKGGDDTYRFAMTQNDYMLGGLAQDTISESAGGGVDTLDFSGMATIMLPQYQFPLGAVSVNLNKLGQSQTVSSRMSLVLASDEVENVLGTALGDTLQGNARDNRLEGRGGGDRYVFENASRGTDTIVEANSVNNDLLDFSAIDTFAVNLDLSLNDSKQVITRDASANGAPKFSLILSNGTGTENTNHQGVEDVEGTQVSDKIFGNNRENRISGNRGEDELSGRAGKDILYGDQGYDDLYGGADNDKLHGGTEDDLLCGEGGDDTLDGWSGNDELRGGEQNDKLLGGSGKDNLEGGNGYDQLDGESGDDELWGQYDISAPLFFDDSDGYDDLLIGGDGFDFCDGWVEVFSENVIDLTSGSRAYDWLWNR